MAAPRDSATLSPTAFLTAIRKGKRFPLLLLRGTEEYLLRQAVDEYVKAALDPAAADFDYNEFRSQEVNGETLWNALTTLPLLGSSRMVVLELAGEPKKDVVEVLSRYAARPSATTQFVIVSSESSRQARGGDLPSSVIEVEFRELHDPERTQWAVAFTKQRGATLKPDALRYLIETSSKNLADIAAKLDHAILFLGHEKDVTVQVLMKVSGVSSEYTVFNLEDAILDQQAIQAHRIARSLLEGGEVLLRLLAIHRSMILKLWQVSAALKKPEAWHQSPEAAEYWEKVFKRQLFNKNKYLNAARVIGVTRIREAVVGLLDLEVGLKTGVSDPYRYYEWIWKISSQSRKSLEPAFLPKS
jgi:DNA polymerase III subunit delta